VNTRALRELFRVADERKSDFTTELSVSVLEIYNETIGDLLFSATPAKTEQKYEVKQGADGMYVPNITSISVNSLEDVQRILTLGNKNRSTGKTNMNEHSSRSHLLLVVKASSSNLLTGERTFGKLTLVDLAGSERVDKSGVTEDRLKEAQAINKSLATLGNVIAALQTKQKHIPFRDSKLTYLLQDSLGGNSKTLMFVQVSPASSNTMETINSLTFASRVRSIELGEAKKHIEAPKGIPKLSGRNAISPDPLSSTPKSSSPARNAISPGPPNQAQREKEAKKQLVSETKGKSSNS